MNFVGLKVKCRDHLPCTGIWTLSLLYWTSQRFFGARFHSPPHFIHFVWCNDTNFTQPVSLNCLLHQFPYCWVWRFSTTTKATFKCSLTFRKGRIPDLKCSRNPRSSTVSAMARGSENCWTSLPGHVINDVIPDDSQDHFRFRTDIVFTVWILKNHPVFIYPY